MSTLLFPFKIPFKELKKKQVHVAQLVLTNAVTFAAGSSLQDDGLGNLQILNSAGITKTIFPADAVPVSKTADYTVLAADNGKHFDNIGAAGSVNFTLPAVASSAGFTMFVHQVVDQAVVITAPAGTLVGPNNAGRATYTSAGAGNRIGVDIRLYCNGAKWFLMVDLKGLTIGTYA